ncbi:hypothetical protein CGRA01v4_09079 [Colletotrichum graminicola]|nr:hypothetical protein CGRA01v4_09079 [Colletotrichum graminicola]
MCVVTAPSPSVPVSCKGFLPHHGRQPTRCGLRQCSRRGLIETHEHGPPRLARLLNSTGLSKPRPSSDPPAAHRRP